MGFDDFCHRDIRRENIDENCDRSCVLQVSDLSVAEDCKMEIYLVFELVFFVGSYVLGIEIFCDWGFYFCVSDWTFPDLHFLVSFYV